MTIGVFGNTYERAKYFLEELLFFTDRNDVKQYTKLYNEMTVELMDGTIYKTVPASNMAMGRKFAKIYVEHCLIAKDIFYDVIQRTVIGDLYDIPKEEQIIFFGENTIKCEVCKKEFEIIDRCSICNNCLVNIVSRRLSTK